MPRITILAHVLPIAIVIQVIRAGDVLGNVTIAAITIVRIVMSRILEISVVAAIATVVGTRIAIAIIAVQIRSGLIVIDPRDGCRSGIATAWDCQDFAFLNRSRARLADDLRFAA